MEENLKLDRQNANTQRLAKIMQLLKKLKSPSKISGKFKKEEKCVDIHTINVQGVSLIDNKTINATVEPFTNKCLGRMNINSIMKLLNQLYFNRGYITARTYLPKQKTSQGILKLTIIEGKINKLSSNNKSLYLNNLFSDKSESYLNIRNLEQGTDQINRLEGYQSKADIKPTSKIGYSDVIIKSTYKKNVYFRSGFDNSGSESTGTIMANIGTSINNLVGINDQLMIDLKSNSKPDEGKKLNRTISLSYDVPYVDWNFGTRLNETKSISLVNNNLLVNGQSVAAQLKNINRNIEIYAKKNIYRDESQKILFNISWHKKNKVSQVSKVNVEVSTYTRSHLSAGINLSKKIKKNSSYSLDFKIKQGLGTKVVFHNSSGEITPTPKNFPKQYFTIYKIGGSYNTMLANKIKLKLAFDSQYSNDILFGGEMFQIGGAGSVRGHSNIAISGAKGAYLRSTFSFTGLSKDIPLNPQFYVLYDIGYIVPSPKTNGGRLDGKGIGVKLNIFNQRLSLEYGENYRRKRDHAFSVSFNASF
jgi:hemolysin activation/secretion protein